MLINYKQRTRVRGRITIDTPITYLIFFVMLFKSDFVKFECTQIVNSTNAMRKVIAHHRIRVLKVI